MMKYLNFHNYSIALRYIQNVNGKATLCVTHPLFYLSALGPIHLFVDTHVESMLYAFWAYNEHY